LRRQPFTDELYALHHYIRLDSSDKFPCYSLSGCYG